MKRFTIYENAELIGEGVQFSDGTVAVVADAEHKYEWFRTLGVMLEQHPTWGTAWVDG